MEGVEATTCSEAEPFPVIPDIAEECKKLLKTYPFLRPVVPPSPSRWSLGGLSTFGLKLQIDIWFAEISDGTLECANTPDLNAYYSRFGDKDTFMSFVLVWDIRIEGLLSQRIQNNHQASCVVAAISKVLSIFSKDEDVTPGGIEVRPVSRRRLNDSDDEENEDIRQMDIADDDEMPDLMDFD